MKKRRVSSVLIIIIGCILTGYLFYDNGVRIWKALRRQLVQSVQLQAEQTYLPGLRYGEREETKQKLSWSRQLADMAMSILPLGRYVEERQKEELAIEDEATSAMLARKQAEDENQVDENGNLIGEDNTSETAQPSVASLDTSLDKLRDFSYLAENFYTIDSVTMVDESDLNAEELLAKSMRINQDTGGPKILIYHTHSQEAFADSDGDPATSIVGIGRYLTDILNNQYGLETLHHEGVYDLINGKLDRSEAYELAAPEISRILTDNPSIEVVIDLHRDGVGEGTHLLTTVNRKPAAQIMFFNGMSRTRANGDLTGMPNPCIKDNLAFSLQMKIKAEQLYPGFTRKIYLKGYRYNMNLMPKMLLIEAGAQTNTVEEMRNAMEPLAEILSKVLTT